MPKLAKSTKVARDLGVLKGIRKHLAPRKSVVLSGVTYTIEALAAVFEEHLAAMARVDELTLQRAAAVAHERALEVRLRPVHAAIKDLAESELGIHSLRLKDYGIEPDRKPRMTAETKKRANEKRQATRARRGIIGKRRRARMKRQG